MNSTDQKAELDALLADNNTGDISAADMRLLMDRLLRKAGGVVFLKNSTAVKQSILADTPTLLEMDGLDPTTDLTAAPYYLSNNPLVNNKLSVAQLDEYTTVHHRIIIKITTSAPNEVIRIIGVGRLPNGTEVVRLDIDEMYFRDAGDYEISPHFMVFNIPALSGGTLEIQTQSTGAFQANLESVLIRYAG